MVGSINDFDESDSLFGPLGVFFKDGQMSVSLDIYATRDCQRLRMIAKSTTLSRSPSQPIKAMTLDIIKNMWGEIHELLM